MCEAGLLIYTDCLPVRSAGNSVRILVRKVFVFVSSVLDPNTQSLSWKNDEWCVTEVQSLNMPVRVYCVINVYVSDLRSEFMEEMCDTGDKPVTPEGLDWNDW